MQNSTLFQGTAEGLAEIMFKRLEPLFLKAFKDSLAPAPVDDELLDKKQACELLKITPTTIWRWQKEGRINSYKYSKINYYKKAELLNCLILLKK
jgi:hypothetical protein